MSIDFRFCKAPDENFHFNALDIEPLLEFELKTSDELIQKVKKPFSSGSIATVFHVQEVMRIALSKVELTEKDGVEMVHSKRISSQFENLSYHASCIWENWQEATEKAGGVIKTILQRMLGVRFTQPWW